MLLGGETMFIAIPSLGRWDRVRTFSWLPYNWQTQTRIFVQSHEAENYRRHYAQKVVVLQPNIKSIDATRDFIIDYAASMKQAVLMMDDDLDFATRRVDDLTKFQASTPSQIARMLEMLDGALHSKAHVAVSVREGAQRNTDEWITNNRAMRVLGYRPDIIKKHGLMFEPASFMCDFHMTLELLKLGYENYILNWVVNNQPGSNNQPGGCTGQRTPELQTAAAEWLATKHFPFVTLVKKQTKTSWGGEERTDVRIQWKAAYMSGRTPGDAPILDDGKGGDSDSEDDISEAVD